MWLFIFPPSQDSLAFASDLLLQTNHFIYLSFVWKTLMCPSMNSIFRQKSRGSEFKVGFQAKDVTDVTRLEISALEIFRKATPTET